jgi:hypothetical protein
VEYRPTLLLSPLSGLIQETNAVLDEDMAVNFSVTGEFVGRYATIQSPSAERAATPLPLLSIRTP